MNVTLIMSKNVVAVLFIIVPNDICHFLIYEQILSLLCSFPVVKRFRVIIYDLLTIYNINTRNIVWK